MREGWRIRPAGTWPCSPLDTLVESSLHSDTECCSSRGFLVAVDIHSGNLAKRFHVLAVEVFFGSMPFLALSLELGSAFGDMTACDAQPRWGLFRQRTAAACLDDGATTMISPLPHYRFFGRRKLSRASVISSRMRMAVAMLKIAWVSRSIVIMKSGLFLIAAAV